MDNAPESQRKKKTGSPRYPGISLQAAITRAKVVWDKEGKHATQVSVLARHWNYSEQSSSTRTIIAALGYYGLMEPSKFGSGDYHLTERALRILAGTEPERQAAIRSAALEPRIYKQIWDRFHGELPSDDNLTSRLTLDWDFNRASIPGFLKDFRATISFANLDKEDIFSGEEEQDEEFEEISFPAEERKETLRARVVTSTPPPQNHRPMNADAMLPIPLDIGDAFIPRGMSSDDFDLLLDSLKLWKRKIVRVEQSPAPEENDDFEV